MSKQHAINALSGLIPMGSLDEEPTGKPLHILLTDIQENPDNPRAEFNAESLQELADDIKANGVISPVSVYLSPEGSATEYTLNYGARRFRASELAGMTTIPAFVADQLDAYQRVAENEQRQQLEPLEVARFIQSRLDTGESRVEIAQRMNKTRQYVSQQLALLDLDAPVLSAFESGVIKSPRTATDLSAHIEKLSPEGKEKAMSVVMSGNEITRSTVDDIKKDTAKNIKKDARKTIHPSRRMAPEIDGKSFKVIGVKDGVMTLKLKGDKSPMQYRLVSVEQIENDK